MAAGAETTVRVRLIGPPCIEGGPGPVDRRGQKPWALLARLVMSERPLSRREIAGELFPGADDPLGALRWTLAGLRRAMGSAELFTGDPVSCDLPDWLSVDVLDLENRLDGGALEAIALGELLEGLDVRAGPEFETWLLVARQYVSARVAARLRDGVIRALARREHDCALRLAEVAARRAPFDEGAQILLVKSLAVAGHGAAAMAHVQAVKSRFLAELGAEPSPALQGAARAHAGDAPLGVSRGAIVRNLIDSGRAAIQAGAIDAGIDCLRRASDKAEGLGDRPLLARSFLELGTALVHSIRGYDDEGAILLEQAAQIARDVGDVDITVVSLRERGYADALAGRRPEAQRHLATAREVAGESPVLLAGVLSIEAFNLADWGRLNEGISCYEAAIGASSRAGDRRQEAWALGAGAWALLTAGDACRAVEWATRSVELVRLIQWRSYAPWPLAVLYEANGALNDRAPVEACFVMSCELDDPCWEGASGRLLAIHHANRGDLETAVRWIDEAAVRCARKTDAWVALVGEILMTKAELLARAGDRDGAEASARHAVSVAAGGHVDGLLPRGVALLTSKSSREPSELAAGRPFVDAAAADPALITGPPRP